MNSPRLNSIVTCREKHPFRGLGLGVAVLLAPLGLWAQVAVDLGSASPFAVLAGTGITITGATTIVGDLGSFPTTAITGFENVTLDGINHGGDLITQAAKIDLLAAYGDAEGRSASFIYGPVFDLGGLTLPSGVYRNPSSFGLTGTLTFDALGDANAFWIFQAGSTVSTASGSVMNLIGGAQVSHIIWQVGSSATLGTGSHFAGSILASESITLTTGATIDGGLYALNGAVTLDSNSLAAVPEPSTTLLLASGLVLLGFCRRRLPVKL